VGEWSERASARLLMQRAQHGTHRGTPAAAAAAAASECVCVLCVCRLPVAYQMARKKRARQPSLCAHRHRTLILDKFGKIARRPADFFEHLSRKLQHTLQR